MAERVGFVPDVPAPINGLGRIGTLAPKTGPTVATKIAGIAEPGVWRPDAALNLRTGHRVNALRRGESSIL